MGLYANGDVKHNGVAEEGLEAHIEYNRLMRFGRALFVDGKCVYKGYLGAPLLFVESPLIPEWEEKLAANPVVFDKPTIPYH